MNPRLSYRQGAAQGASPVRLVILLYEQALEDLRRALSALARGDIEERTREMNHALLVIGHLQATLDPDRGGEVAANLERFYAQLRTGLVEAQCKQSPALLEQQISLLFQVCEAWRALENAPPQPISAEAMKEKQLPGDWSA
jgi:flagellar secretion chaperone FliS